jgi:iron complex outermembrane receptor protein
MRTIIHGLFVAAVMGARTLHAQTTGSLTGRVSAADGAPLQGATVSVSGTARVAMARGDGRYQLALPSGRYEVRTRLLGYAAVVDSVTIGGQPVAHDVTLQRVATSLESVAIIGTRGDARTVISAPVPIDVLSAAELTQSGRTETAQMLQAVAPSINFPRATVADGTDHIRPATLRGLAPDQTLVLINGKRRHTSALVNVNGYVGRGAEAVDLNAIPASMIDHIEILRDGAAAQYGSDAIAGVINIVLKTNAPGALDVEVGQNVTTYNRDATGTVAFAGQTAPRSIRDGGVLTSSLSKGWSLGSSGFVQIVGEVRNRQGTNRTLADTRQQYFAGDSRNTAAPRINHWQGDSYNHDAAGFFNAGTTLANGLEVYTSGGLGRRRGVSAGFWRRANDDRTLRQLFPDGFLPFIKSEIADGSITAGVKGAAAGWTWDLGTVYGRNAFDFTIDNSANTSLGPTSKTRFYAGQLAFGQSTTTLDVFRQVATPWSSPLRVALGGEFRGDMYEITAGEPDSYRNGNVRVLDASGNPTTRLAAVGSQVFPGFQPTDAGSHSRTNAAAYVDFESDLTKQLLVGVAARAEHYSDFGGTTTGKLAARYEPVRHLALRGAVSTGFRAPSLGQEFFSSTATNFIAGQPFDIRTFPVSTAEARLLGAADLEPERSTNYSAGLAIEPVRGLAVTADWYQILIDNRIVLSDNFTGATIQALFAQTGSTAAGGRFFTNAIDTKSNGVDVVANYDRELSRRSSLKLTSGYNHNLVKVTRVDSTPANLKAFQETLFGRVERTRIEQGNPRDNFVASATYRVDGVSLTARSQRYGEVSVAGLTPTNVTGTLDQTFAAKWISDVSASFSVRQYGITIGADNVFDVYPDRNLNPGDPATGNGGISNFGIFPYNAISPFGFNGRFVYTRISVRL